MPHVKLHVILFFYVKLHVIVLVKLPTLLALPPPKEVVAAIFWWWPEISTIPLVINDFPVEVAWFSRKNIKFRWRLRDSTENIKVPMQQHKENIQTTIRFFFREIEFDWFRRRSSSRRFSRVEINEKEKKIKDFGEHSGDFKKCIKNRTIFFPK